jgi:hypothetical protein
MNTPLAQQQSQMLAGLLSADPLGTPDFIANYQDSMRANTLFSSKNEGEYAVQRGWLAYRSHASARTHRTAAMLRSGAIHWPITSRAATTGASC